MKPKTLVEFDKEYNSDGNIYTEWDKHRGTVIATDEHIEYIQPLYKEEFESWCGDASDKERMLSAISKLILMREVKVNYFGVASCALCVTYFYNSCRGCPVYLYTGETNCRGVPQHDLDSTIDLAWKIYNTIEE